MGRSPASSCLRIISCAGRDDDDGDLTVNVSENKSSGDKRGWSFRKKSGKQRGMMISNVVSDTTPATRTRETLESALLKSPSPDNNSVSEKQSFSILSVDEKKSQLPVVCVAEPVDEKKIQSAEDKAGLSVPCLEEQIDRKSELPILVESKGTETEEEDLIGTGLQANFEGPNAADASGIGKDITSEVEIASKVELEESETDDVVVIRKESDEEVDEKLDESVIIIIQAAIRGFLAQRELLRCKKVVKLQAAVRGHLVRSQAMGSLRCVQAIVKMQALVRARQSTKVSSHVSAISDKAESNSAAQKLLENKFAKHLMESSSKTNPISIKCDPTKPSSAWNWLERWMSVSKPEKAIKTYSTTLETKTETGFSSCEASKLEAQQMELSEKETTSQYDSPDASAEVDHDLIQPHPLSAKNPDSLLEEPECVDEQPKYSSKEGVLSEEGRIDIDLSASDTTYTKQDDSVEEITLAELGGSEYGIEISVTSSLDTLEKKSDIEGAEPKVEAKLLENGTIKTDQAEVIEIDVKDETSLEPTEKVEDEVKISAVISTPASRKRRAEDEPGPQTPTTITESQATPASQASSSVKARKGKSEKSGSTSTQKRKVSKKITSSPKEEPGTSEANTTEQKSGRRNSFGVEQEARESSGSKNSLPRFMQPTQSAKAKVQEHNSPRSSPDIQERDKKRHSLPVVANGKEGSSPRIQKSASPAQLGTKDRKWQR